MSRETEKLDSANAEDNTNVPNDVLNSQGPQARNKGKVPEYDWIVRGGKKK